MDEAQTSQQVAEELLRIAEIRYANPKVVWGIPWSGGAGQFPTLDKLTGGIEKYMHVLVSRPNVGKSAFAAQVAINAAEFIQAHNEEEHDTQWVGVITSEMAATAYQRRMACILSGVDNNAMKNGFLNYHEQERQQAYEEFIAAVNYVAQLPLRFIGGTVSVAEIGRFVLGTRQQPERCALFILDHIGLVTDTENSTNARALDTVSKRLRSLCQQYVPGLILGHINRESLQTASAEPSLNHVAGADQICRDADWVIAPHRPDLVKAQPDEVAMQDRVYGKFKILKARDGDTPNIDMWYHKKRTYWSESK